MRRIEDDREADGSVHRVHGTDFTSDEGSAPKVLVVLCGLSFSGKSTIARGLAERLAAEVISFDAINAERGLASGQGVALKEWVKTKETAHARARALLADRRSVVIDDTSSPAFLRDEWRAVAAGAGVEMVLVYVALDREDQRARVAATRVTGDRPDVLDVILEEHHAGFEPPTGAEAALTINGSDSRSQAAVRALTEQIRSRIG